MLKIHTSNQLTDLFEEFNKSYQKSSIFEQTIVFAPSVSIYNGLHLYLANKNNISAGFSFSFLAAWIWKTLNNLNAKQAAPFLAQTLRWRIFKFLKDKDQTSQFPTLQSYLDNCDELMIFDLAQEIAKLFEKYSIYRVDWISAWSKGQKIDITSHDLFKQNNINLHHPWQAALWRHIAIETDTVSIHPILDFIEHVYENKVKLPEHMHIFCESSLAQLYLQVINAIAHVQDVHLYVFNPSKEYWFDITTQKQEAIAIKKGDYTSESVNPFLANWGRERQKTLSILINETNDDYRPLTCDSNLVTNKTVLERIQNSIFELQELKPGELTTYQDSSIEIHVAHSRTREIEILHDQILRRFKENPNAKPEDFLVVVSDLKECAAIIESIFDNLEPKIPYKITGYTQTIKNSISSALTEILSLAYSRVTAADFLNIISHPLIAEKFDLTQPHLDTIKDWLCASGTCWGLNAQHKESFSLPPDEKYTFEDGLKRLFLSYAFNNDTDTSELNRLPEGSAFGTQAILLGKLWKILQLLCDLEKQVKTEQTITNWQKIIFDVIDNFIAIPKELISSFNLLQQNIVKIFKTAEEINPEQTYVYPIISTLLEEIIENDAIGATQTGQVTFTNIQTMRLIPYDYLFILGMDEKVFPSKQKPREFDLIAATEKFTDITKIDIERNTFLDLLLAAKKELYISYTGRSIKDNKKIPPSILVSELLNILVKASTNSFNKEDLQQAYLRYVFEHPLHAFSEKYFTTPHNKKQIVSFQQNLADALNEPKLTINNSNELIDTFDKTDESSVLLSGVPFCPQELERIPNDDKTIKLNDLIAFYRYPARFFMQKSLGARFGKAEEELPTTEKIELEQYTAELKNFLIPYILNKETMTVNHLFQIIQSTNKWPAGHASDIQIKNIIKSTIDFTEKFKSQYHLNNAQPISSEISVNISNGQTYTVKGDISDLKETDNKLISLYYSAYKKNVYPIIEKWFQHLFLCASCASSKPIETQLYFFDKLNTIPQINKEHAQEIFKSIVNFYLSGQNKPSHFLPKSSFEYALSKKQQNKKDKEDFDEYICRQKALEEAKKKWVGSHSLNPECNKPYNRTVYRGNNQIFDEEFETIAIQIFAPYLNVVTEE